jgi:hypothetical protein
MEVRMEYDAATTDRTPQSGLLLSVDKVQAAEDRGKANGAVADNDGND